MPDVPGARVRVRRGGASWQVRVDRLDALAALVVASIGLPAVSEVEVQVRRWRPPVSGWLGAMGLPGLISLNVDVDGTSVMVRVEVEPLDPGRLLAGIVRVLGPMPVDEGPELTFAPGLPAGAGALAGAVRDVLVEGEVRDPHVRRCDVLLVPMAEPPTDPGHLATPVDRAATVQVAPDVWVRDGRTVEVCVDPSVHRPIGRRSQVDAVVATATMSGDQVHLVTPDARIRVSGSLSSAQVSALGSVDAVVGDLPAVLARQLNACGVLTAALADQLPRSSDPLDWQVASVHERRHALRQYTPPVALDSWPEVSALLVTHRPDHLEHAVQQLSRLRYPRLEVVLGLHGDAVDPAWARECMRAIPYPAMIVTIDGSRTLGEALQYCSGRASGSLLTKVDDDDCYGPEHIWDLVLARMYSGAQIVGKALDWIHLESDDVTAFRPVYPAEKYATFVAGGTIMVSRGDLASVGGWRPVPKSVDRALLDRVLADGGLVYRTHGLGYVYMRRSSGGRTAAVQDSHFLTKTAVTLPGLVRHPAFGTDDLAP